MTEDVIPAGWDFQSLDCSGQDGGDTQITGAPVTFDIDNKADVLDCTYTNRARGTIIVEKITDDGSGSFDFTSSTLSAVWFTLTTTAAGEAGKDSETFGNLNPGTYDVAETVPAGWNLVSSSCDDGSDPASIGLSAGETVTCTFHDARERGRDPDHEDAEARGGWPWRPPAPGGRVHRHRRRACRLVAHVTTNANGRGGIDGLVLSSFVGDYTVHRDGAGRLQRLADLGDRHGQRRGDLQGPTANDPSATPR